MTKNHQRILVVGTSGSGKTTLANQISRALDITHTELDSVYHGTNWKSLEKELFQQKIENVVSSENWVIDGNYRSVREIILKKADTLIWLDYKISLVLSRVAFRTFRRLLTREVLWNGNRESFKNFFHPENVILWALRTHRRNRNDYLKVTSSPEFAHLKVLRFRSPVETERWLKNLEYIGRKRDHEIHKNETDSWQFL